MMRTCSVEEVCNRFDASQVEYFDLQMKFVHLQDLIKNHESTDTFCTWSKRYKEIEQARLILQSQLGHKNEVLVKEQDMVSNAKNDWERERGTYNRQQGAYDLVNKYLVYQTLNAKVCGNEFGRGFFLAQYQVSSIEPLTVTLM